MSRPEALVTAVTVTAGEGRSVRKKTSPCLVERRLAWLGNHWDGTLPSPKLSLPTSGEHCFIVTVSGGRDLPAAVTYRRIFQTTQRRSCAGAACSTAREVLHAWTERHSETNCREVMECASRALRARWTPVLDCYRSTTVFTHQPSPWLDRCYVCVCAPPAVFPPSEPTAQEYVVTCSSSGYLSTAVVLCALYAGAHPQRVEFGGKSYLVPTGDKIIV